MLLPRLRVGLPNDTCHEWQGASQQGSDCDHVGNTGAPGYIESDFPPGAADSLNYHLNVDCFMRIALSSLVLVTAALPGWATAEDTASQPPSLKVAIDRGLSFLAKDALAWKNDHNCVSCHHAGLVTWAMHEAKARGHAVDETVLADLTNWMTQAGDGKTGVPRPEGRPKALNTKAIYFALALNADAAPNAASREAVQRFVETIKSDQLENGSWVAWPETRPPMFGPSDESMTALAVLALLPTAAAGDEPATASRNKGVEWLAATQSDEDAQSIALRLMLWTKLQRPVDEWRPLLESIRTRQNGDGGWSQTKEMASDAWATGQALYALAGAGVPPDDSALERGRAFLLATQREDGSWPMTSRPSKPDDSGAANLVPITGAGSAWGVIGLARSY